MECIKITICRVQYPILTVKKLCSASSEISESKFVKDKLTWEGLNNNEGTILYNTLIATGDWSLGEIRIEELL